MAERHPEHTYCFAKRRDPGVEIKIVSRLSDRSLRHVYMILADSNLVPEEWRLLDEEGCDNAARRERWAAAHLPLKARPQRGRERPGAPTANY